ncbi:MAG: hypothetical protein ABI538_00140 [Pseudoxanthomonas sp.]
MRTASLKPAARVAVRIASWLLSLAGLGFFVRLVMQQGIDLSLHPPGELIAVICAGAVVYAMAVVMLSLLWTALVQSGKPDPENRRLLVASYLKSQFAKYLPGNVLQYAIRHALARRTGMGHGALAAAALLEAALLSCAALALVIWFGIPGLHLLFADAPQIPRAYASLVLIVVPLLAWMPERLRPAWLPRYRWSLIAGTLVGYAFFFILFGGLFFAVLAWCSVGGLPFLEVVSSSSLAWLVGFLVPGAPAGAGLRETALALAAGATPPSQNVLTAIVLFRLITLGGDLVAFLIGHYPTFARRRSDAARAKGTL